jgi:hypothetical protein
LTPTSIASVQSPPRRRCTLRLTAARPVREPHSQTAPLPIASADTVTTVDQGRTIRRARTTAPIVQNAVTAPSLFGSASVPDARIM